MRNKFFLMEEAGDPAGGGGGTQFDAAAFRTEIFSALDGKLNGFAKSLKTELTKLVTKPAGEGGEGGDPPPDPKPGESKQSASELKMQRELEKMRKDLDAERAARSETEAKSKETNRKAAISAALNGIPFANEKAALAAQRLFDADVRYNEAGELVAGPDEQPVGDYIKAQMREHEYLLAPKQTGGSGANPGKQGAGKAFTLDDIKPGMKPEDLASISAQVASIAGVNK
jgi:hypothetical protein